MGRSSLAVDSATRHCCGGIGDHTAECDVPATLAAIAAPVDAQHVETGATISTPATMTDTSAAPAAAPPASS
ncbi:hypothetical protein [Mycolicibacterium canariasense]|uniref:hypothetical protein n=1 Tax=Mycolicibacterium canariasense TaxID=228230 RepID=UPI0007881987|nr:hypothetical protein [Mycolicibacterium canariasense]MCV7213321.1 hypothetical protein [Mycolicibacterium canariasense]ORV10572.1 hypothetical protein AWB94_06565 [Mycolicibacterium canariasense]